MKYRGYTLIEIAITLTVVLMLSSLLVVNYYGYDKTTRNREAARHLAQIKTAVVNYAAVHTTDQRFMEVVNVNAAASTVTVRHLVPAGRPYLPCPDISGDGYEDRLAPPSADTLLSLTLNATIAFNINPFNYPLESSGGCVSSRGIVPWRTLDSPSVDPWGNRYSYRVAGVFSNVQTGFDQYATAGNYVSRPLSPTLGGVRVSVLAFSALRPSLAGESGPWNSFGFFNFLAPAIICDVGPCPPGGAATSSIIAGAVAAASVTLFNEFIADFDGAAETRLTAGELISGVPFVVVSHGENGYGGVRTDVEGYVCNPFPVAGSGPAEYMDALRDQRQNAIRSQAAVVAAAAAGDPRYECELIAGSNVTDEVGFVGGINGSRPHTGRGGYDDLVDWMSMDELIAALSERGTLPARLPPPIGLEQ
ncbi:MAG: type II secretion system protein [Gammaproteobacteria bacterium]